MDNITHTLTGLFLSRAGLNRFTPAATPLLLIAANLPDADAVSVLGGATAYFHWHRHLTHSLFLVPFLALALVGLFRIFHRSLPLLPAFLVASCGILSHLSLDLTNIYGIRLFLPFQGTWFHLDLTPVIDFWIWAAFLIAIAGPFLARLIGSEIGEHRSRHDGRGFAVAALIFLCLYNGGRAALHSRVVKILDSREYDGAPPRRIAAFPASMNPLEWRGMAETDTAYELFQMKFPIHFDPALAETTLKASPSPAIDIAARTNAFQVMADFAQYPIYHVTPRADPEGGEQVELSDVRFGFTSTALVNRKGAIEKSWFQFGPVNPR